MTGAGSLIFGRTMAALAGHRYADLLDDVLPCTRKEKLLLVQLLWLPRRWVYCHFQFSRSCGAEENEESIPVQCECSARPVLLGLRPPTCHSHVTSIASYLRHYIYFLFFIFFYMYASLKSKIATVARNLFLFPPPVGTRPGE